MKRNEFSVSLDLDVDIVYNYTPEVKAYISGPPENCHDGESEVIDIKNVLIVMGGLGHDITSVLSKTDMTMLESRISDFENDRR